MPRVKACPPTPTACPGRASRAGSPTRPARPAGAPISPRGADRPAGRSSVGLLGDVYFGSTPAPRATSVGGFRATSGLLIGARSTGLGIRLGADQRPAGDGPAPVRRFGRAAHLSGRPTVDNTTLPYIGIGYSNLSAKSGWIFSADLGVVSQSPGNVVRFGRVFGGSQSLDDVVRDMRLAPVVQLGVSYSF